MKGWSFYIAIFIFFVGLVVYSLQSMSNKPELIVYPERVYNVFWTGGYDSTFTVLYLLKYGDVQPIYLRGCIDNDDCNEKGRKNQHQEEQAMDTIRQLVQSKYTLLPTKRIDNIKLDKDTLQSAREANDAGWGSRLINQNVYIAQYCKDNECIGHVSIVFTKHWSKFPVVDKGTTRCRNETLRLFKNFRFPCIHLSKHEMRRLLKNDKLLAKTWSCWFPQNGIPCGECVICKQRII